MLTQSLALLALILCLSSPILAAQDDATDDAPDGAPPARPATAPAKKPAAKPPAKPAASAPTPSTKPATATPQPHTSGAVHIAERGSERSTTGPGNNIVTHKGKTHIVWQECDEKGYYNVARTFDHASGQWSPTYRIGPGKDNHARSCIAVDSKGFLHVVIGGHGSMMYSYRSKAVNDASAWAKPQPIDIGTYPMLVCGGPEDTLVLAARHDKEPRALNLFVKQGEGPWQPRKQVFTRLPANPGYAGFNASLVWGPDGKRLHLAIDSYESGRDTPSRGVYQAVAYLASDDLGQTWKKADGSPIPANANTEQLDVIARFKAGPKPNAPPIVLRNGGVAVDAKGNPCVYFIETKGGDRVARLVTPDGKGAWRDLPLDAAFQAAWPNSEPSGARGSISSTPDGALHILFMIEPRDEKGRKVSPGGRFDGNFAIGMLSSRDAGLTFTPRTLLPHDPAREVSLASIERQTGYNDMANRLPSIIYMDGLQRYPVKGEYINTDVYWHQPR